MDQGFDFLRREQRRAAGDFLWNGDVLPRMGMHDWFAEEFVLSQRRALTYVSVCSGIEAATVAWHPLGWKPLAFAEIESFPSRLLAYHYPRVRNVGDFTKPAWSLIEGEADVLVGGTPCQAFSVAGLRKSLSDDRGNLTLEFIRVADALQPSFIVWENVPGVLSTRDNAFGCFLAGLVGADGPLLPPSKRGRWPRAGLVSGPKRRAAWRVLDAQYFGLAQRRKRVFVVACPGDGADPAEILFEPEGMQRDSAPRRAEGEGSARGVEIGFGYGKFTDVASTLDTRAKDGPMRNQAATAVLYPLDLRNALRDPQKHDAQNRQGCVVGHSSDPSPALTKGQTPGVAYAIQPGALRENPASGPDGAGVQAGLAYTLAARAEVQVVGFYANDSGTDAVEGMFPTLRAMSGGGGNRPAVAFSQNTRDEVRLQAGDGSIVGALAAEPGMKQTSYVSTGAAVRRLTPRECERLQGFPDDYTAIPGAADSPRYKALGNSMAVPVMRWIGERIDRMVNR